MGRSRTLLLDENSSCSQNLCCSSLLSIIDPLCLVLGALPSWQGDSEAKKLPPGFSRVWAKHQEIDFSLQYKPSSSWISSTYHTWLFWSLSRGEVSRVHSTKRRIQGPHCPTVFTVLPDARFRGPGFDPDLASLSPDGSGNVQSSEEACRPS